MSAKNRITVEAAISALKSGEDLSNSIITNLDSSKVSAMNALLLAENGFVVPDGNVVYNDDDIHYDPDFDEVEWGEPKPFNINKKQVSNESVKEQSKKEGFVVEVQVKDEAMIAWMNRNQKKLNEVINKLLIDFYETGKMLKD